MASVQLSGIEKAFGSTQVLRGIDLSMADGQFVALVGPSGCGKSTLLRILAGLETADAGEIRIGDRAVTRLPPKERDIAMVFQNYALYPHMTVAENMGFSMRLRKAPKAETAIRVGQAARMLGIEPLLGRYPREISGGQRQRVALGRAIVRDPQVFLFDEPLSNLDAKLRVQTRVEIKALQQRLGTTTIYVTHDQIEAMTMADKVVVLNEGRVEQAGAPLGLYDRPANLFVASFIGSPGMNLVPGVLEAAGIRLDDGQTLAIAGNPGALAGRRVVLGIRPQDLVPAPGGLTATVSVVEPTGAETHVVCQLGSVAVTSVVNERFAAAPGAALRLKVDPARVHLFDAAGGGRIDL